MKRFLKSAILAATFVAGMAGVASAAPQSPIGDWLTGRGGAVVQIAPCADGAGLCGHIVGLVLNRDAKMPVDYAGQPQCGFELIRPSAAGGGAWHGGIVDPRNGSVYHAEFHVARDGALALRGYVGLPIFGETQHWARYTGPVPQSCRIDQMQVAAAGAQGANRRD